MKLVKPVPAVVALVLMGALTAARAQADTQPEVLHYKFNGTGTSVPNLATAPPPGTATATIMGSITQNGTNLNFGGTGSGDFSLMGSGNAATTDYLNTGYAPNLGTGSWTISFISSNITPSATLFYIFGDINTNSFRCFTNGVAGPNNWILRATGMTDVFVNGGATVATHRIAFVYDNSLNNIKAYLDGVLVNTVAQGVFSLVGAGPLKVMGYSTNVGAPAGGLLDDFRLYSRALSAADVAAIDFVGNTSAAAARTLAVDSTSRDAVGVGRTQSWYRARLFAGRSYQISAWPADHEQGVDAPSLSVSVFSDDAGTVPATGVTGIQAALEGTANQAGDAKPYTATIRPTATGVYKIQIMDASAATVLHTANVALRETTLTSPWTSRAAGYEGFVEIHNNSADPLNITINAYDTAGALQGGGLTFAVPGNATVVKTATQVGVPVNVFAGMVLTHDGAVGAVSANITTLNPATGLSFDAPFTPRNASVEAGPVR